MSCPFISARANSSPHEDGDDQGGFGGGSCPVMRSGGMDLTVIGMDGEPCPLSNFPGEMSVQDFLSFCTVMGVCPGEDPTTLEAYSVEEDRVLDRGKRIGDQTKDTKTIRLQYIGSGRAGIRPKFEPMTVEFFYRNRVYKIEGVRPGATLAHVMLDAALGGHIRLPRLGSSIKSKYWAPSDDIVCRYKGSALEDWQRRQVGIDIHPPCRIDLFVVDASVSGSDADPFSPDQESQSDENSKIVQRSPAETLRSGSWSSRVQTYISFLMAIIALYIAFARRS